MKLIDKTHMLIAPLGASRGIHTFPVLTTDIHGTGSGVIETTEQIEQSSFTGARDTNYSKLFTRFDIDIQIA